MASWLIISYDHAAIFPSPRAKCYSKHAWWAWGEVSPNLGKWLCPIHNRVPRACQPPHCLIPCSSVRMRRDAVCGTLEVCWCTRCGSSSPCCKRCKTAGAFSPAPGRGAPGEKRHPSSTGRTTPHSPGLAAVRAGAGLRSPGLPPPASQLRTLPGRAQACEGNNGYKQTTGCCRLRGCSCCPGARRYGALRL